MRLLVIGNAALDRFFGLERLPAPGESVFMAPGPVEPGGKGLNQAVMAARTGAAVTLLAMLGRDATGEQLRRHLAAEGLADHLLDWPGASDESHVLVAQDGQNMVLTTRQAALAMPEAAAMAAIAALQPGDLLLMQGNLAPALTQAALRGARARGVRTLFNPSPVQAGQADALPFTDILIVNEGEAARFATAFVPAVVTTLGAKGARLRTAGGSLAVPAPAMPALDTTGAGDVLAGVLAGRLALGDGIEAALRRAVLAASLKVARAGTASGLPAAAELAALSP